jgi:Arc/MetJ-type ribon-helix-helix transcriptional regulator
MNLSAVPEEYRALVDEKLASGSFGSLEEILRDALRLWGEREQLFAGRGSDRATIRIIR